MLERDYRSDVNDLKCKIDVVFGTFNGSILYPKEIKCENAQRKVCQFIDGIFKMETMQFTVASILVLLGIYGTYFGLNTNK